MKISIIISKNNNPKKRRLKISLAVALTPLHN